AARRQAGAEGAAGGGAYREGQPEREDAPDAVEAVDRADEPVLVEILPVLTALLHPEVVEEPADVRVDEAAHGSPGAVAVADVRRVRVPRLVREGMVLAVVRDPLGERALHRHAPEDRERRLHRLARAE